MQQNPRTQPQQLLSEQTHLLSHYLFFTEKQEKTLQGGKVSYKSGHCSQVPRTLFINNIYRLDLYANIFQRGEQILACTEEEGNLAFPSDMMSVASLEAVT